MSGRALREMGPETYVVDKPAEASYSIDLPLERFHSKIDQCFVHYGNLSLVDLVGAEV